MRRTVKYSLAYLITFIAVVAAGYQLLPQQILSTQDQIVTGIFALIYFVVLPTCYWRWVIKVGHKKAWRIVIALSLSSLATRYSFPDDIAAYFDFIAWLRYPFIAILIVIEFALFFVIIRSLWRARYLGGDPRLMLFKEYKDGNAEQLDLALLLSYEPASWYYAIPYFSRNHVKPLANLATKSAHKWFLFIVLTGLLAASVTLYYLLLPVNELIAIIAASFVSYGVVMAVANYRVSRHYSIYVKDDLLVFNDNFLNLMAVELKDVATISTGHWPRNRNSEDLHFGGNDHANIELHFKSPQIYFGWMGLITEHVSKVRLSVDQPGNLEHLLDSDLNQEVKTNNLK